ncbi:MAG: hypothetical protein WCP68_06735 [Enhydrobacter sp.]
MGDPTLVVIVILLAVAGIAGTVILLLMPARERILNDEPAVNDARVSGQWAGGLDAPAHHLPSPHDNVIHHDFGGGPLH